MANEVRGTIAVLTSWADDFQRRRYLLKLMVPLWEDMGFQVVVVTERDAFVPATVAFVHVDLSVMPLEIRALARRYPRAINFGAVDIRKSGYSRLRLAPDDNYSGPVLVKTNCNGGGGQEFKRPFLHGRFGTLLRASRLERPFFSWATRLEALRPWDRRRMLDRRRYRVFPSKEAVPAGVWRNPNLLVERLAAERDGSHYCCRLWLFCGSREVCRRTISKEPLVRCSPTMLHTSDSVPEELRAYRRALGVDYGKFDYGIIDGEVVLYDANTTPGALADSRMHTETVKVLAPGVCDFIFPGKAGCHQAETFSDSGIA